MGEDKKDFISIVIPCYNSEKGLASLIELTCNVMDQGEYEFEIILIDDGSKDKTFEIIRALAVNDNRIKGAKFSKNFGQHASLIAGYSMTKGNIIVGLNDDGEQDPSDIPKLINKLKEGYDYVCASHDLKGHSISQKMGSRINNYCCIKLLGQPKGFYFSSYYAMNRFLIDEIIKNKNPFLNINGLILSITKNVTDVYIPLYKRKFGKSGYTLKKSIRLWLDTYTAYTIAPLRLCFYLTAVCIVLSLGLFIFYLFKMNDHVFLIFSVVLLLFSMMFSVLSIFGEYIGRIYMVVNGQQQYTIREETGDN